MAGRETGRAGGARRVARIRFRVLVALMTAILPSFRSPSSPPARPCTRSPPRDRSPPLPPPFSPLRLPTTRGAQVRDDSGYVIAPRACHFPPPLAPTTRAALVAAPLRSCRSPLPLPPCPRVYLPDRRDSPRHPPSPTRILVEYPAARSVYTRYVSELYIFSYYSGHHSARSWGTRQSPLVHRAVCYRSSLVVSRSPP